MLSGRLCWFTGRREMCHLTSHQLAVEQAAAPAGDADGRRHPKPPAQQCQLARKLLNFDNKHK